MLLAYFAASPSNRSELPHLLTSPSLEASQNNQFSFASSLRFVLSHLLRASMFALLAAGRLPQSSFTQLDATHCIFELQSISDVNHLCVFMDGSAPFPQGYAGTVHLLLPGGGAAGAGAGPSGSGSGTGQQSSWRLLGCLKNERPSAIYRLKGLSSQGASSFHSNGNSSNNSGSGSSSALFSSQGLHANPGMFQASTAQGSGTAMLGISVEPEHVVDEQMRNLKGGPASTGAASASRGDAAGVQGMDIADEGMAGEAQPAQGALVRSGGGIDPYMALALAPKIGEFLSCIRDIATLSQDHPGLILAPNLTLTSSHHLSLISTSRPSPYPHSQRKTSSPTSPPLPPTRRRKRYRCCKSGWSSLSAS